MSLTYFRSPRRKVLVSKSDLISTGFFFLSPLAYFVRFFGGSGKARNYFDFTHHSTHTKVADGTEQVVARNPQENLLGEVVRLDV